MTTYPGPPPLPAGDLTLAGGPAPSRDLSPSRNLSLTRNMLLTRRGLLALLGVGALVGTSGCGVFGGGGSGSVDLVRADVARLPAGGDDVAAAGATAVCAFTADLYGRLAAAAGATNLVCSPYSAFVALAMTAQGAVGATQQEMLQALHSTSAADLAAVANTIDQALASRAGTTKDQQGNETTVELTSANSLWGQKDLTWQPPFLESLARFFGTGMRQVDYRTAPEPAREAINGWVSQQTKERIPELIPRDLITAATRLVLVNAIYLKAPWLVPFSVDSTQKKPFTRLDGSTVQADLMQASVRARFAKGDGWSAVDLPYAREQLALAVVVPDSGRFAEVETGVDGAWLTALLSSFAPNEVVVGLPRWTTRTQADLGEALKALGIRTAFTDAADLSGTTTQEHLEIAAVVQEGFIAVDENGTEAAAATAVIGVATSAPAEPVTVVADRPFLYVLHDVQTRVPLFVGRVLDPTA